MAELAAEVGNLAPDNGLRVGKVVQVVPLIVNVAGGMVEGAGSLASVAVGDSVSLMRQGQTWLVLGVVSPAAAQWGTLPGLRGSVSLQFTNAATTRVVTFPTPLPRAPAVVGCNLASAAGPTLRVSGRAYAATPTQLTIYCFKTDATEAGAAWDTSTQLWHWWAIL